MLVDAVRLGKKVYIIISAFSYLVAYELLPGGRVNFFGYVGPNGPSNYKLKNAVSLSPAELDKLLGQKIKG